MSRMILRSVVVLVFVVLAAGCGKVQNTISDTGALIAKIYIPQPTAAQGLRNPITKIKASIGRYGNPTQSSQAVPENGSASFSFTGLAEGTWSFSAEAYDSNNVLAFKGSASIAIVHGKTTTTTVSLQSVGTGTIELTVDVSALIAAHAPVSKVEYAYSYLYGSSTENRTGEKSFYDANPVVITLPNLPPTTVLIFPVIKSSAGEIVWQGEISGEVYPNETTKLSMTATNNVDWTGGASVAGVIGVIPDKPTNVQTVLNADKSVTFTFTPSVDPVRYYTPIARIAGSAQVLPAGSDIVNSGDSIPYRVQWQGKTVYFGLRPVGNDPGYTPGYMSAMCAVTFP